MSLPVRGAWIEMPELTLSMSALPSLPVRGAWIEISAEEAVEAAVVAVAPRAGSVD